MDTQLFVACLSVAMFAGFAIGYVIGHRDREALNDPTEHGGKPL